MGEGGGGEGGWSVAEIGEEVVRVFGKEGLGGTTCEEPFRGGVGRRSVRVEGNGRCGCLEIWERWIVLYSVPFSVALGLVVVVQDNPL